MASAAVPATPMFAAGMAFSMGAAVMTILMVMVAGGALGSIQLTGQQRQHRRIRAAMHTCIELDTGLRQRALRTSANATADQRLHAVGTQKFSQCPMAAALGVYHLGGKDLAILRVKQFELGRVPKMLKHLAVFIGGCNTHNRILPFL